MSTSAIDFTKPIAARIRDVLSGGKQNFAADGQLAERLLDICPSLGDAALERRAFITRAVTWAARQGIYQFAELGTGMPGQPSAGDAARAVIPAARIAYVDSDPVVTLHVRALLATCEDTAASGADPADPAAVLIDPAVLTVIDPAEPVCLIFGPVLDLMPARQAREVVAGYAALVAPGSYVALTCGRCDDEAL